MDRRTRRALQAASQVLAAKLPPAIKDHDDVLRVLEAVGEKRGRGWGHAGNCGRAAIAMNKALFGGKGKYVAGLNTFLWHQAQLPVGHVVVQMGNTLWDVEGEIDEEDVLAWGMLGDFSNVEDYLEQIDFTELLIGVTEAEKERWTDDAEMVSLTAKQAAQIGTSCPISDMEKDLLAARKKLRI